MLFYLSQYVMDQAHGTSWEGALSFLRVLRYVTVRSAGAAVTALVFSWWLGPGMIDWLRRLKFGQDYKDKAEEAGGLSARILDKRGTPSMGGIMIVTVLDMAVLLWAKWNSFILLTLLSLVVLAALGFYDDYMKMAKRNPGGVAARLKLWTQFALAAFIAGYLWWLPKSRPLVTEVMVPFLKEPVLRHAAWAGILLTILSIVGSSNAVNLTDGLDGLAAGCVVIVTAVFFVLTYVAGNQKMASYLLVPYVPEASELAVFCAGMMGTVLGFLWFNCHPAKIFMGDTGSLALGGALGIMAVLIHQPLILPIAGGVFVAEASSVLIQTGWFKWTRRRHGQGRRIFLMAPLHHHFEKLGWYESQVVTRFYILCILCAVVALGTLKLR